MESSNDWIKRVTWGAEIEAQTPYSGPHAEFWDRQEIGDYRLGEPVDEAPVDGWRAKSDSSVSDGPGRGVEFMSPVYSGPDGLRQVRRFAQWLESRGVMVDESTGLHVHVGFDVNDTAALKRLITLASNFELAIYAVAGNPNRARDAAGYAGSIRQFGTVENAYDAARNGDRGRIFNFSNLFRNGHGTPTIEMRAPTGTVDADRITAYIRLATGMVERAVLAKRSAPWTPTRPSARSPFRRGGEGATHVARLFYQLGWFHGLQAHTHGELIGDDIPDLVNSKRVLMKLARDFDAAQAQRATV